MKKYIITAAAVLTCLTAFSFALAGGREYISVAQAPNMETGYIEQTELKNNQYVLTIDAIEWYEGEQAVERFKEREGDSGLDGPPDGYYVINDDYSVHSLPIAKDAVVLMQIYNRTGNIHEAAIIWNEQISVDKFVNLINNEDAFQLKNFPYHFTVTDGEIVRIVQQYVP